MPLVHQELHQIAARCMRHERAGHSLQATALVNEAYIRLIDAQQVHWQDRTHFFAISARLMRRVLVDHARARLHQKRGAGAKQVTLVDGLGGSDERPHDVIALDDALAALGKLDERKARVVELRYFGGLSVEETAQVLGVSGGTVMREWKLARAWLIRELGAASATVV
jgi:RNA polymerase sigma-70 factor, ECF subfamily